MSLREACDRPTCGHDKSTHHAEPESTGDVTKPGEAGRIRYGACLGSWCDCPKYLPPKQ